MITQCRVATAMLLLCLPLGGVAQTAKLPQVGFLAINSPTSKAFLEGLRDLGYVDGKNVRIHSRTVNTAEEAQLPQLAAELVKLNVDVIVAPDPPSYHAAIKATRSIPIVMRASSDPVREGIAASYARPGGNVTGMFSLYADLNGKRLALLKEAVPGLTHVMILVDPCGNVDAADRIVRIQNDARELGLKTVIAKTCNADEFAKAFQAAEREHVNGLLVVRSPLLNSSKALIVKLASTAKLPSISDEVQYAALGGLMTYGPDLAQMHRHLAVYVDKILKGAKAGEIPIEQPTKFELAVNSKTARTLGLKVPESILLQATKVIQ